MAQITVKDGLGANQTIGVASNTGQQNMSASMPVVLATDHTPLQIATSEQAAVQTAQIAALTTSIGVSNAYATAQLAALQTANLALLSPPTIPQNVDRDAFITQDSSQWDFTNKAASDLLFNDGNVAGCGWLSIIKSALVADTYTEIVEKTSHSPSLISAAGLSVSNRINGQELAWDVAGVSSGYTVDANSAPAAIQLSNGAGAVSSGTVMTMTTLSNHNLLPGMVVVLYGCTDGRVNYGPVTVSSTPTATTFTFATALGAATYIVGTNAYVREYRANGDAKYVISHRFVANTAGNNDTVSNNGSLLPVVVNTNTGNTNDVANIVNENGLDYSTAQYVRAFRPKTEYSLRLTPKYSRFVLRDVDNSTATPRTTVHRSQNSPDPSKQYVSRFRARNLPNMVVPLGPITAASKSGSTTATLTIPNHGLTTSHRIIIYGIRDQTNFANSATSVAVASVVDANNITCVFGASATATSYGGWVALPAHNDTGMITVASSSVQTYAKTTDGLRLSLVFAATPGTGIRLGEVVTVYGLVDSTNTQQTALYGRYRVDFWNTTTFTFEGTPLDGQSLAAVSTTPANAGGTLIKNTEFRLHYWRAQDLKLAEVEIAAGAGDADVADSIPVSVSQGLGGTQTVTATNLSCNVAQVGGTTAATSIANGSTNRGLGVTLMNAVTQTDVSAGAFAGAGRVNGTVIASAQGGGAVISAEINVSTLTLGSATSVVAILQESRGGTNYTDIWTSSAITATGVVSTPPLTVSGRRRWAFHSIGGTSTTVTVTITTLELFAHYPVIRQFRDVYAATNPLATVYNSATQTASGLVLTTLNSATTPMLIEGMKAITFHMDLTGGPTVTTQPVLTAEFSNNGTTWWTSAATLTAAGNGLYTVDLQNKLARFARLKVTTAAAYSSGSYTISSVGLDALA